MFQPDFTFSSKFWPLFVIFSVFQPHYVLSVSNKLEPVSVLSDDIIASLSWCWYF
jgi:hypothetical protein